MALKARRETSALDRDSRGDAGRERDVRRAILARRRLAAPLRRIAQATPLRRSRAAAARWRAQGTMSK
jgi:hypothetical protein